jgi:hypothetical protein
MQRGLRRPAFLAMLAAACSCLSCSAVVHWKVRHLVRDNPQATKRCCGASWPKATSFATLRWFRPGSGKYDARMLATLEAHGYRCALGSVYPFDPQIRWSWFSRRFILSNVQPGSVVILHDWDSKGRRTVETLSNVLPVLAKRGFRVVTLTELESLRNSSWDEGSEAASPALRNPSIRCPTSCGSNHFPISSPADWAKSSFWDSRVVERGQRLRLAPEALQPLRARGHLRRQHLERDVAPELREIRVHSSRVARDRRLALSADRMRGFYRRSRVPGAVS